MNVVCCQVDVSALDHSFGEVVQSVLCLSEISKIRESIDDDRNTGRSATGRKERNMIGVLNVQ